MKQELDELLCARYPKLFRDRRGDMTKTCMTSGFACGDGWFNLIDTLAAEITARAEEVGLDVVAIQVKEKFGGLRYYLGGGDEYVHGLVGMASRISEHTCEECGAPGWMNETGWMKVRCAAHGGNPPTVGRKPKVAHYVVGKKGIMARSDNDLIIAGKPQPEPVFRLPEIRAERFRTIAAELEQALDLSIRRNKMPMVFIDEVIEGDALAFRWHGGDEEGEAAGMFRFVEAYSARIPSGT